MDINLKTYLEKHNIQFILHIHPAFFTVSQHKELVKSNPSLNIPGLHTKNLFLKDEKNNFFLVCLPAEKILDLKDLKEQLNIKGKLSFATSQELKDELNLTPGSVSIFAMIYAKSTTLILDKQIWESDLVGFHPNINTATLTLNHIELEKFTSSLNKKPLILSLKNKNE